MNIIADVLMAAGAFGAGLYCFVLQRRLMRFNHLEHGMGAAVAVLSAQVDDLARVMKTAQNGVETQTGRLDEITIRADAAAVRLELLMSSLHDLPETEPPEIAQAQAPVRRFRVTRTRSRFESEAAE